LPKAAVFLHDTPLGPLGLQSYPAPESPTRNLPWLCDAVKLHTSKQEYRQVSAVSLDTLQAVSQALTEVAKMATARTRGEKLTIVMD
jgi:hypothetical protein